MKLLDDQISNQRLLKSIEDLKNLTNGSKDMGARLFMMLSTADVKLIEDFKTEIQPMSTVHPVEYKTLIDAVNIVFEEAKLHDVVRNHLRTLAESRGKAKLEMDFVFSHCTLQ